MATNIADTHAFPFSAVGIIGDTIGGVASHGSGVLIAPDELLTAAHVVFTTGVGTASTSTIFVQVDRNDADAPFGISGVTDFHYLAINDANSESTLDRQGDFALLHLSAPVSGAGTMTPVANFSGGLVHATGYPDSAGSTSMVDAAETITPDPQSATFLESSSLGTGTSGGPLWTQNGNATQVTGVVSSTVRNAGISAPVLALLNSWIAADHAGGLSGAIAVTPPPLLHAITTEAAPPGVNPAEAALFDSFSYGIMNPDVTAAGVDPLTHFASFGWHERRAPDPLFDVGFYLQHNPDVAAAGIDPLLHYANFGWKEGRDPSASFSTSHYLAVNPDVRLAGLDPLQHYVMFGVTEGRSL